MDKENLLLVVDGSVNLALGIMLIFFFLQLIDIFDLPKQKCFSTSTFWGSFIRYWDCHC